MGEVDSVAGGALGGGTVVAKVAGADVVDEVATEVQAVMESVRLKRRRRSSLMSRLCSSSSAYSGAACGIRSPSQSALRSSQVD